MKRLLHGTVAVNILGFLILPILTIYALPPSALPSERGAPSVLQHHENDGFSVVSSGTSASLLHLVPATNTVNGREDFVDRALVLCWHSFLGDPSFDTDFSLAELGRQLDSLISLGYHFPSLEELLYGRIRGSRNIVVTLDDGHRTVPAAIEKVFRPRGIEPALFVYPAVIGTTSFSMDDGSLNHYASLGIPVGAHGYHHLYVTEELFKSDPEAFNREIYKAKEKTETLSGRSVLVYAYPFGALSPRTKEELRAAGYAFGFSVKSGFVYADPSLNDPYELPRLVVTRSNWNEIYAMLERNARESSP